MAEVLFEVCVDSVESAIAARNGGADRIELCADLLEGGTTPSAGTIELVCEKLNIPVMVMVRPRGGDFCYSEIEFEEMKRDIGYIKKHNPSGIVIGILNRDGTIDKERTETLVRLAAPLKVTFHRAFDMTRDPFEALDLLINLGIERVLTSGQALNVEKGIGTLKKLVETAGKRILIMPGGGVDEFNAGDIILKSGAREIHASAREKKESPMEFRNPDTTMSDSKNLPEYELMITSETRVRAIRESIENVKRSE
jgi:copper homeostasis protein